MPVNSTHADYLDNIEPWQLIRDVLAGDRVIKRAGEKYVARLDSQSDDEFRAYVERGSGVLFSLKVKRLFVSVHRREGRRQPAPSTLPVKRFLAPGGRTGKQTVTPSRGRVGDGVTDSFQVCGLWWQDNPPKTPKRGASGSSALLA